MDRWQGKTALVTGASSGIGYSVVEALAKEGVNVIGCARNIEKIEELKNRLTKDVRGSIEAIKCDLGKEDDILAMFNEIEKKYKVVHILINNAGMAKPDDLLTGQTQPWRDMVDLNIIALSICAREAIRLMDKNGVTDGHIVNVNSLAGHIMPNMGATHFYSASKHMVTALSKALVMELSSRNSAIRVTNLSPGAVDTEFASNWVGKQNAEAMKQRMNSYQRLQAEDITNGVLYVLSCPAHATIRELTITPTQQQQI